MTPQHDRMRRTSQSACHVLLQTLHISLTQRSPNQGQTSTLQNSQGHTLATWCKELTHWQRAWCWARLKAGGEGDNRGWDRWMASSTRWTWVWESSGSWWWTGKPGMLLSMGSQRVGHDWMTEQQKHEKHKTPGQTGDTCRKFVVLANSNALTLVS